MRNIDKHITPMEQFCIWGNGFHSEDCDKIKDIGELFEFQKGRVGSGSNNSHDPEVRDTDITWIMPNDDTYWIFERMNELAGKINFDKFQMDLKKFDGFQYSKYQVDGHYDWHTDIETAPREGLFRKLSFSLMLSDPEEYEGGELLIADGGNNSTPISIKLKKGELLVFYSHLPHKVAPVTKGERITLVTWALGEKIR